MSTPSGKTTFTLAEAAELLRCHRETLRRAIRSGELRAAKLGRGFRISRFDLEAFWSASGGGDLFGKEPESAPEAERRQTPAKRPRQQGENRQMQFSLPVTGGPQDGTAFAGQAGKEAGAGEKAKENAD